MGHTEQEAKLFTISLLDVSARRPSVDTRTAALDRAIIMIFYVQIHRQCIPC